MYVTKKPATLRMHIVLWFIFYCSTGSEQVIFWFLCICIMCKYHKGITLAFCYIIYILTVILHANALCIQGTYEKATNRRCTIDHKVI